MKPVAAPATNSATAAATAVSATGSSTRSRREAAMTAHWEEGRDLESPEVLRDLLTAAGMDAEAALAWLSDPEVPRLLAAQRQEAARWGVTGIPTWFVLPTGWTPADPMPPEGSPRPVRVVGCQPIEVVERAAEMAGATRR